MAAVKRMTAKGIQIAHDIAADPKRKTVVVDINALDDIKPKKKVTVAKPKTGAITN